MDFDIKYISHSTVDGADFSCTMHAHNFYEIYCFLSGGAEYYVEGNCYKLQPGDIMVMRKGESHYPVIEPTLPYERIVLSFTCSSAAEHHPFMRIFNDRPLGRFNCFPSAMFPDLHCVYYLDCIKNSQSKYEEEAFFLPLLAELSQFFPILKESKEKSSVHSVAEIIQYINDHIALPLSLDHLSERFFISKSHLNRMFKKATGTTAWNYIVVKRLLMARSLLSEGMVPTDVYLKCGFRDYTTFFRAYKKHFGSTPKEYKIR